MTIGSIFRGWYSYYVLEIWQGGTLISLVLLLGTREYVVSNCYLVILLVVIYGLLFLFVDPSKAKRCYCKILMTEFETKNFYFRNSASKECNRAINYTVN